MAAVLGLLAAMSIGMSDLFGRKVINASTVVTAGSSMQIFGSAAMVVVAATSGSRFDLGDFAWGSLSGVGIGAGVWFYYSGLVASSSAIVAPIVASLGALVPFAYTVIRGDTGTWIALVGAALTVSGLVFVTGGSVSRESLRSGLLWSVLAGLSYALGGIGFVEASGGSGWWPAVSQRGTAAVLMVAVALAHRVSPLPPKSQLGNATALGVVVALTSTLYLAALGLNPSIGVIAVSVFPAFSVLIGRTVFADAIRPVQILGIALVIGGVAAVSVG